MAAQEVAAKKPISKAARPLLASRPPHPGRPRARPIARRMGKTEGQAHPSPRTPRGQRPTLKAAVILEPAGPRDSGMPRRQRAQLLDNGRPLVRLEATGISQGLYWRTEPYAAAPELRPGLLCVTCHLGEGVIAPLVRGSTNRRGYYSYACTSSWSLARRQG